MAKEIKAAISLSVKTVLGTSADKSDSGTIDIETRTGAIDIDAAGAVTIDTSDTSNGIKIGI